MSGHNGGRGYPGVDGSNLNENQCRKFDMTLQKEWDVTFKYKIDKDMSYIRKEQRSHTLHIHVRVHVHSVWIDRDKLWFEHVRVHNRHDGGLWSKMKSTSVSFQLGHTKWSQDETKLK